LLVVVCAFAGCGSSPPPLPVPSNAPVDSTPAAPSILVTLDMGSPHIGDAAPALELIDQNGEKVSLASLRGSVVMLAFVTSWCPFSEAEQPWLARLADEYKGKSVKFLAIDIKEDDAGYTAYLKRTAMPMPVLKDPSGEVTARYTPPKAQPAVTDRSRVIVTSNLVLDREGQIRFFTLVDTAHFDAKLVHARQAIDQLLAEGSAK
jgi:peroxiredoxin